MILPGVANLILFGALAFLLVVLARLDLLYRQLPFPLVLAVGFFGILNGVLSPDSPISLIDRGLGMMFLGGGFLLVRDIVSARQGQEAMGLGDVKLAVAAGTWIGWQGAVFFTLLGAVIGLLVYAWLRLRNYFRGRPAPTYLPGGIGFSAALLIIAGLETFGIHMSPTSPLDLILPI